MATKRKSTTTKRPAVAAKKTSKTATKRVTKTTINKSAKALSAKPVKIAAIKPANKSEARVNAKPKKILGTFDKLRRWNLIAAFLHAAQAVAVVLLSGSRLFPVTTSYLTTDSLAPNGSVALVPASRNLFDVNLAYVIVAFFAMSAVAHLLVATKFKKRYEADLETGVNKFRWIEYALSASTMIVAIAMIAGVADFSTLLMMFGLTAIMNLCGLVMELHNRKSEKVNWLAYIVGCIAGALPWVVYAWYVFGSAHYGNAAPPKFVYAILVSIFLMFNSFAINMYLQYKRKGKWADYLYGEKAYIVLSLVAKTLLAWQVFAGALRP